MFLYKTIEIFYIKAKPSSQMNSKTAPKALSESYDFIEPIYCIITLQ